jgi:hypothetical protein
MVRFSVFAYRPAAGFSQVQETSFLRVLLPRILAVCCRSLSRRNGTKVGVDRVEISIRHVPIVRPRHDSQVVISNRVVTCAYGDLELF